MYKRLGLIDIVSSVQKHIENNTIYKCYDYVPNNIEPPYFFIEIISKKQADTKTMYKDVFEINIHGISPKVNNNSSIQIYEMVNALDEALTKEIELPNEFEIVSQINNGLNVLKTDETSEKHSISSVSLSVCYGMKCKGE